MLGSVVGRRWHGLLHFCLGLCWLGLATVALHLIERERVTKGLRLLAKADNQIVVTVSCGQGKLSFVQWFRQVVLCFGSENL